MPFDGFTAKRLLSVEEIKRLVRAVQEAGLLFADNPADVPGVRVDIDLKKKSPWSLLDIDSFDSAVRKSPYFTPHGAIDDYLGIDRRNSCPCRNIADTDARDLLGQLETAHDSLYAVRRLMMYWTDVERARRRQFEQLLAN